MESQKSYFSQSLLHSFLSLTQVIFLPNLRGRSKASNANSGDGRWTLALESLHSMKRTAFAQFNLSEAGQWHLKSTNSCTMYIAWTRPETSFNLPYLQQVNGIWASQILVLQEKTQSHLIQSFSSHGSGFPALLKEICLVLLNQKDGDRCWFLAALSALD